jgi:hypothetical protein
MLKSAMQVTEKGLLIKEEEYNSWAEASPQLHIVPAPDDFASTVFATNLVTSWCCDI